MCSARAAARKGEPCLIVGITTIGTIGVITVFRPVIPSAASSGAPIVTTGAAGDADVHYEDDELTQRDKRARHPNKELPYPFSKIAVTLSAGTSQIFEISDALSFFCYRDVTGGGTTGSVHIILGDSDVEIPVITGLFLKTSGFRRFKLINTDATTHTTELLLSADPEFIAIRGVNAATT